MIYAFGRWHKEKADYEREEAEREARRAEQTRPLDWDEYREQLKNRTPDNCPSVLQLRLETVPEDQRYFFESAQKKEKERLERGY